VAYSCRVRCFCPSCHEKRALEKADWVSEHICAEVPHRQFVFTIPKRLRNKSEHNAVGRFPKPGDEELLAGPSRNFQVYEADPLNCPKSGSPMRIIAIIERRQTEVIEKILRHCGLWKESPARGPPSPGVTVES